MEAFKPSSSTFINFSGLSGPCRLDAKNASQRLRLRHLADWVRAAATKLLPTIKVENSGSQNISLPDRDPPTTTPNNKMAFFKVKKNLFCHIKIVATGTYRTRRHDIHCNSTRQSDVQQISLFLGVIVLNVVTHLTVL